MKPLDYPIASRRALLGGMAALAAGPLALRPGRAASSHVDVVIVGAGAAGIGAAIKLKQAGISCLIVEAANRVGGRALTDTTTFRGPGKSAVPFDIGCAWIHNYDAKYGDPFADWSRKLHFETQAQDLGVTGLYYGSTPYSKLMVDMVGTGEDKIKKWIKHSVEDKHEDVAVGTLIEDRQKPMDASETYLGPMDMGVDVGDMSAADFDAMAEYDPNYLVREGYGTLVKMVALQGGLDIALGTAVTGIDYSGSGVNVHTGGRRPGVIDAKAVIVTVSTGVLASGAITFTPPLPVEHRQAIDDVPMGLLAKIPLQIPGVGHYLDGILPYDNVLDENGGLDDIYFLAWPWNSDLMVGFVGGKFGWDLSRAGPKAAVAYARQKLGNLFGSSIARKVTRGLLTPWATDPLVLGAYSAARPGRHASRKVLGRPVHDKLFFAGEATAPEGMFATCSGAYMAGTAAAAKIAEALGVHSPAAAP